jgi:glycosyltransferase involved in cell wall biosynthesis
LRIALDATYSIGSELSGVGIYSRQLITELLALHPEQEFRLCYRPHRFLAGLRDSIGRRAGRALLTESGPLPGARLLHGLNQRLPERHTQLGVATFHDLFVMTGEYSTPEFRARFTEQARHAAAAADLIITVSSFTAAQVTALLNVPESRIRVIHHGVQKPLGDTPGTLPEDPRTSRTGGVSPRHMPEALSAPVREPLILFVGALQKRKNIVRLIDAFEQTPPEWRLVLVGSRGYGAEEIDRALAGSRRKKDIQLMGYLGAQEFEALWARAGIFAFPSLDEGFGMPVLEAMARGVPVLTSRRSATGEIAGDAALTVDPYDTEEIAQGLHRLCVEPGLRSELSRQGLGQASRFTWRAAAEKTWSVYRELL